MTIAEEGQGNQLQDEYREHFDLALLYFSEAAPKHTLDEEESLFPRLRASLSSADLVLLDKLHSDHLDVDTNHQRIDRLGRKWLIDGSLSQSDIEMLTGLLQDLAITYEEHIRVEDEEIFPLAKKTLSRAEMDAIASEMMARRGVKPASRSFKDLLKLHQELDKQFLEHQCALLRGELSLALTKLEEYETLMLDHMWDEEQILLPIFEKRAEAPIGGSADIFRNEHSKIRQYLELFKAEFEKLWAADDREKAIIFLLDSQTTFKRLLVHHDTRERKFLYPILDEVTTESERVSVFEELRLGRSS